MRFGQFKLVNYIPIYNGLGLHEISIDFTKCKYNKVIIKGKNGSGKSTIRAALKPKPDKASLFIPGLPAMKYLEIIDNDVLYQIKFVHGVNKKGERESAKAYIIKIVLSTGDIQDLNPNGNISSYNDIIYSELGIDSNFEILSSLSTEEKGLAYKTPSERKKYVSTIVNTLEAYNDIYKNITKRANTYSSLIKSLSAKINNIGNVESLTASLNDIETRLKSLNMQKEGLITDYTSFKSKIEVLDPNNDIQNNYNNIYSGLVDINKKINHINDILTNLESKLNPKQLKDWNCENMSNLNKDLINSTTISIHKYENDIQSLLLERDEQYKTITKKTEKLNSLQVDNNYRDLEIAIKQSKAKLQEYENIFQGLDISKLNLSSNEFILGLNSLLEIKNIIDSFNSDIQDRDILRIAIDNIRNGICPSISDINNQLDIYNHELESSKIEYSKYSTLMKVKQKLELKPSNCSNCECAFIKDAIEANRQEPEKNIALLEDKINILERNISETELLLHNTEDVLSVMNQLNVICRSVKNYSNIFDKLPIRNIFCNRDTVLDMILNGYSFNEINTLYKFIDYANIIDEYKNEKDKLYKYEIDYKIYESKNEVINDILSDIEDMNKKLDIVKNKINESNETLMILKSNLMEYENIQRIIDNYLMYQSNKDELIKDKSILIDKYNKISSDIKTIKDCISNLDLYSKKIEDIDKEINPLVKDRDTIKHGLIMLQEYYDELNMYKSKYEKIEVIKKYSSPNKGIQTLFINMYMNTTLKLANELIQIIFNGDYVILPYVINDNEFRIPVGRNGIANDDISSLSTAEVSMISMIISFVLMHQSASKYNIASLDEIDGGLDNHNRIKFVYLIDQIMRILGMEQLILISHNNELNMNDCDVIILKTYDDDEYTQGNIIYRY